ncbi:zinc finger protein ZAT9-like [Lotus japonicus]|uniref:zinc finger protein ZAT9-like n=1 Tax=Lotus japonicus TaxID=34305 RepID=UPI002584A503|nr:zinc finger protein ZAT9-like [Lotus japonicus]
MALIVDQQSNFKHFCKICKKGFGCGRALGGHMRAHGIGDEAVHMDDDDPASDWEGGGGGNNVPPSNKRMYALRTNPNRLKSCRACENCGKEFLSWKSFLEHGKCTSEDAESLVSSPGSDAAADDDGGRRGCGWSKRKRSLRTKVGSFNYNCPSSEEEDLANCLMMLSNAIVDPLVAEPEESCASASRDEERRNPMNFIAPLSYRVPDKAKGVAKSGLFECKACKKVFNSHQALGGHRASHKKVKGCFAARLDNNLDDGFAGAEDDLFMQEELYLAKSNSTLQFDHGTTNNNPTLLASSSSKKKSKVHECSICHRSFSSGQALGGHKRCHWITSNAPDTSTLARFQQFQEHLDQVPKFDPSSEPIDLKLDLNLPAPTTNDLARRNVSTEFYLQPWVATKDDNINSPCQSHHQHLNNQVDNEINNEDKNNNTCNNTNVDNNEADNKVKLAKLSELKDINIGSSSSPWLQVGIGSTTDVRIDA